MGVKKETGTLVDATVDEIKRAHSRSERVGWHRFANARGEEYGAGVWVGEQSGEKRGIFCFKRSCFSYRDVPVAKEKEISEWIDAANGFVKRPWENPYGDGVWRSSGLYACLLLLRKYDSEAFEGFQKTHSVDLKSISVFLDFFARKCVKKDHWIVHPDADGEPAFSRDQLMPLLLLLSLTHKQGQRDMRRPSKFFKVFWTLTLRDRM